MGCEAVVRPREEPIRDGIGSPFKAIAPPVGEIEMSRGRTAAHPHQIPAGGWKDIALRTKDEIERDHVGLIAAGVAFYGLLAIFPGIAAVMAIGGLVTEPSMLVDQLDRLAAIMPQQAADIILSQAREVAGSREDGLGLAAAVGILLALWSASKGVSSLMEGLNVAYDEEETRGFFAKTLTKLGLTVGLVVGLLLCIAIAVGLPVILAVLPGDTLTEALVTVLRWPLILLIATAGLAVLYRFGPARSDAKWRWLTPGAGVACVLWVLGSLAFAFYVRNFASYNETFGTLGGVVVLLMWMWLSAFIVLLGAELDSEMEAQTRRDTTTGPEEPMGSRGAVKADTLGDAQKS